MMMLREYDIFVYLLHQKMHGDDLQKSNNPVILQ